MGRFKKYGKKHSIRQGIEGYLFSYTARQATKHFGSAFVEMGAEKEKEVEGKIREALDSKDVERQQAAATEVLEEVAAPYVSAILECFRDGPAFEDSAPVFESTDEVLEELTYREIIETAGNIYAEGGVNWASDQVSRFRGNGARST